MPKSYESRPSSRGSVSTLDYRPPDGPLRVIAVDAHVLVLAKPAGLLSVPGKAAHLTDCLEARARAEYPDALTVHRLDLDTSGITVMGRGRAAHRHLSMQFAARQTAKTYLARVWGAVAGEAGRVDLPLRCDWDNRPRQIVDWVEGRPAQTDWRVLAREDGVTRLELTPLTGRSHQLRVHMLMLGHPILGDPFYASGPALAAADRLQLHAETLGFFHPEGGGWVTHSDPCPF